jgi:hypothetical protein
MKDLGIPWIWAPMDSYEVLATGRKSVRMSASKYDNFSGFLGHQNVPENTHLDGEMNLALLNDIHQRYIKPQPKPNPIPLPRRKSSMFIGTVPELNNRTYLFNEEDVTKKYIEDSKITADLREGGVPYVADVAKVTAEWFEDVS